MRQLQKSFTTALLGAGLAVGISGVSSHLLAPRVASADDRAIQMADKDKDKDEKGVAYPNLHKAMDSLKEAKEYLEKGSHNMRGHRVAAIEHVDKAIAEIEAGLANPDSDEEKPK
jgi:hypothetical protein